MLINWSLGKIACVSTEEKLKICVRFEVLSPSIKVQFVISIDVGVFESLMDILDLIAFQVQFVNHLLVSLI